MPNLSADALSKPGAVFPSFVPGMLTKFVVNAGVLVAVVAALYSVYFLVNQGHLAIAICWSLAIAIGAVIYTQRRFSTLRYLYPSFITIGLFVILPIALTAVIGFTNYSGLNLISKERAHGVIMGSTIASKAQRMSFSVLGNVDGQLQIALKSSQGNMLYSEPFTLAGIDKLDIPIGLSAVKLSEKAFALKQISQNRNQLKQVLVQTQPGIVYRMSSLRQFSEVLPQFEQLNDHEDRLRSSVKNLQTNKVFTPNDELGFYQSSDGEKLAPGYYVNYGWKNYIRTISDPNISGPFWSIFVWTIIFASVTVLFTLFLGLTLACLISIKDLRGRHIYRVLLILPYAVPAFISILVFKGLFNQSFGEINLILEAVLGISPQWFDNPWLAKAMVLIVNTWLGYPYIMILSLGLLKTIPDSLYEAAAIEGAGVLSTFFRITLPLVLKPLMPLLVASFAFNFNNFVIIALLTKGGPDFLDTTTPAGHTDLLVSYTYRMAFQDSGQNFALAAAISMLIFVLVGSLAMLNMRLAKVKV